MMNTFELRVFHHDIIPRIPSGKGPSFFRTLVWKSTFSNPVITEDSPYWSAWCCAMEAAKTSRTAAEENPLWALFPFMTQDELEAYLAKLSAGHKGRGGPRTHHHGGHHHRQASR
jgi:hypothetical protein